MLIFATCAVAAPFLTNYDPAAQNLANRLASPSAGHWLGTDELGRDVYTRLLYGARSTLGVVSIATFLIVPVGLLVGALSGYVGGKIDMLVMRVTDVFLAFPRLALVLAFVAALKPGILAAVVALVLTGWPAYARLARADARILRDVDYISAVKIAGAGQWRIVWLHIVPMCLPSIIARASLDAGGIILTVATLGFLGMGVQPPTAEWGMMVSSSRAAILQQWWVPLAPAAAIFVATLALSLFGEGVGEIMNPRRR